MRETIAPQSTVTITIVEKHDAPEQVITREEIFSARRPLYRAEPEN